MNIQEMHVAFRTLGQQMGMQTVRAILPESIDVFLNEVINEKVRNAVMTNVMTQFRDRVAIQDNSISPINSVRTLVKKGSLPIPVTGTINDYHTVSLASLQNVMFYTSFGVKYPNVKKRVGTRFIENDKVDDTRSDYCNRDTWDYPIVTMYADSTNKEHLEIYAGAITKVPNMLEVTYIELPAIVKWTATVQTQVSCNLPVYVHNEIVELAVSKFFNSVIGSTKQNPN